MSYERSESERIRAARRDGAMVACCLCGARRPRREMYLGDICPACDTPDETTDRQTDRRNKRA